MSGNSSTSEGRGYFFLDCDVDLFKKYKNVFAIITDNNYFKMKQKSKFCIIYFLDIYFLRTTRSTIVIVFQLADPKNVEIVGI